DLNLVARRARDNPEWPEVGIFGHRNMRRVNWLGVSRCRLVKVDGLDPHVEELDARGLDPGLDLKPAVYRDRATWQDQAAELADRDASRLLRTSAGSVSPVRWSAPMGSQDVPYREFHRPGNRPGTSGAPCSGSPTRCRLGSLRVAGRGTD